MTRDYKDINHPTPPEKRIKCSCGYTSTESNKKHTCWFPFFLAAMFIGNLAGMIIIKVIELTQ